MRNPFLFRWRYALGVLVFVCALSLTLGVVYGQQFGKSNGLKVGLVKKGVRLRKNHGRLQAAIAATKKHAKRMMKIRGVVATATGIAADGEPAVKIFTAHAGVTGIPDRLDGLRVKTYVSGRFYARRGVTCEASGDNVCQAWERWPPPVPIGVSTGHPSITAGTIGARVTDGASVFALSNNHVYANINNASIGDNVLQPGTFDEGVNPDDAIGTLFDFEPIRFCMVFFIWVICDQVNQIDAAIAATSTSQVGTATPSDGYGTPNPAIHAAYGDPTVIGDENVSSLLGEAVQKYGRTTQLTFGTVNAVNATVDVCYDQACSLVARFVDQVIITPGTFSAGGDSGSLIVTQNGNNPVGLLFAGSTTNTIANRIDLVLNNEKWNLAIDDDGGLTPLSDIATQAISVPSTPVVAESTTVVVTVRNVGNQPVGSFSVNLMDDTEQVLIGTKEDVTAGLGLSPGQSLDVSFPWIPVSSGPHVLRASHQLGDDNAGNDEASTTVTVLAESLGGPGLRLWQGWVSTDAWTTVTLNQDYGNEMVVVCTPNYDKYDTGPAVVRVRNAADTSFEVGLARPWFGALPGDHWSAYVHCMVVRAGVYTEAEHGVKMEAVRLDNFASKDSRGSWSGEPQNYANSYTNPVVVGQVTSPETGTPPSNCPPANNYICDSDWSVFWNRGSSRSNPPVAGALYVGRHTGEDPNPRPAETLAYVVIEAGSGTMEGIGYAAGLGSDTVRGVDNAPPYSYTHGLTSASTAILSQAGMDGGDGGWAILYGSAPVTASRISIAIDEDWYWDSERRHTTEQVGYIVFE